MDDKERTQEELILSILRDICQALIHIAYHDKPQQVAALLCDRKGAMSRIDAAIGKPERTAKTRKPHTPSGNGIFDTIEQERLRDLKMQQERDAMYERLKLKPSSKKETPPEPTSDEFDDFQ